MQLSTGQTSEHRLHPTHSSSSTWGTREACPFFAFAESSLAIGVRVMVFRLRAWRAAGALRDSNTEPSQ